MIEKKHGFKIFNTDSIPDIRVNMKKREIEFNPGFRKSLTEQELEFFIRWAKIAYRKRTINVTEIDTLAVSWYENKYGSFDQILLKLTNKRLYHRFATVCLINATKKKSIWSKIKTAFCARNK